MSTTSLQQTEPTFEEPARRHGRPPEDAARRRWEIFGAIAPLLIDGGARSLTMRRLARTANVSVGTLYRYFPSKVDLLTYPLRDEYCAQHLHRFEVAHRHLAGSDPEAYVHAFIGEMVATFPLLRAAFEAAVDLGSDGFWEAVGDAIGGELEERLSHLAALRGPDFDAEERARSLKRTFLGAVLDRSITPAELDRDLRNALG